MFTKLFRKKTPPKQFRVPILCYHAMNVHGTDYEQNDHTALDRDITLIKSLGFTIKSLSWIVDAYRREDWTALNHPVIAISFDDAPDIEAYSYCDLRFNEMVESFHSIIARHHVPATSFLIASEAARTQIAQHGAPEPPNLYSSDWWNSTKDTLLDLANHSWDHNHEHVSPVAQKEQTKGNFFAIDNEADAIAQITTAHNHLKAATKDRVKPLFCYPYGHVNEYLRDNFFAMRPDLHEMHAAFSTAGEHFTENNSIWAVPRYVCGHHWRSTEELKSILTQASQEPVDTDSSARPVRTALAFAKAKAKRVKGGLNAMIPKFLNRARTLYYRQRFGPAPAAAPNDYTEVSHDFDPAPLTYPNDYTELSQYVSVIEVSNARPFIGELFKRHFGDECPLEERHFIAFYTPAEGQPIPLGYFHHTPYGRSFLAGGLVIDERIYRRLPKELRLIIKRSGGIAEYLSVRSFEMLGPHVDAIWGHVGDHKARQVDYRVGFVDTKDPHLMVIWRNQKLSQQQREQMINEVLALGPF